MRVNRSAFLAAFAFVALFIVACQRAQSPQITPTDEAQVLFQLNLLCDEFSEKTNPAMRRREALDYTAQLNRIKQVIAGGKVDRKLNESERAGRAELRALFNGEGDPLAPYQTLFKGLRSRWKTLGGEKLISCSHAWDTTENWLVQHQPASDSSQS